MTDDLRLAHLADQWLAAGLDCTPADRARAEAGVHAAYAQAGLAAPELILWFDSPAAGAIAVAMLRTGHDGGPDRQPILDALTAQGARPGHTRLGAGVRSRVRNRPWAQARAAATARLGSVGYARHWAASGRRSWQQLIEQIATPLRTRLDADFAAEAALAADAGADTRTAALAADCRAALLDAILGQHDAPWLGAFADDAPELAGLARVAASSGWWWGFEGVAVLTERPTELHRDNLGRLHHDNGPALVYPDGHGLHAWRGMPIPAEVAAQLPALTVGRIRAEANAEVRRVMLEHFGFDRYLRESGASKTHSDETGTLWQIDLPGDEPLVMVEVLNSSPEPDGTFRTYFLRVPPTIRTARAGVAWTFDLSEGDYAPSRQT